MTALADTIEAALRDAQAPTTSLRWYAETAARAVEPLIRAAEAAALDRAAAVVWRDSEPKSPFDDYGWQRADNSDRHADAVSDYALWQAAAAIRAIPRDGSALDAVVAARTAGAFRNFDAADWFWRDLDPDDCGDTPEEAINCSMQGNFTVCHIRSSFSGPSKFCFTAPVLDQGSDDEECLCFDTQEEAIAAAKERRAALAKLDGGKP